MKNTDKFRLEIKNVLKDGPIPASEGREIFNKYGTSEDTLSRIKDELDITSYKSPSGIWWWADASVKMTSQMKDVWIEKYKELFKEENIEDYLEVDEKEIIKWSLNKKDPKTGATVQFDHYENPYEWLDENSIYYFDHSDDLTQLTNCDETWAIELRRKPQRLENFSDIAKLDPNNLPEMHDVDGEDNVALKWMITSNNWIEEAGRLQQETKDTKYKTLEREEEQEGREHREEFSKYYGRSFY